MDAVEAIEIDMLLEAIYRHSGYEFRNFASSTVRRRIRDCLPEFGIPSISELQGQVLRNAASLQRLLHRLTVNVTAMFRDPEFYIALRQRILPELLERRSPRIWAAGCATGEEVYSLAILLDEADALDRVRIYATDLHHAVVERARKGCFPVEAMQNHTRNYQRAGGRQAFSNYYQVTHDVAVLSAALRRNVVWAQHDLSGGSSFNDFDLILCRNVLIYFNRPLQDRVHHLLYESLISGGVLAVGSSESLLLTPFESKYEVVDGRTKLYRRIH